MLASLLVLARREPSISSLGRVLIKAVSFELYFEILCKNLESAHEVSVERGARFLAPFIFPSRRYKERGKSGRI